MLTTKFYILIERKVVSDSSGTPRLFALESRAKRFIKKRWELKDAKVIEGDPTTHRGRYRIN